MKSFLFAQLNTGRVVMAIRMAPCSISPEVGGGGGGTHKYVQYPRGMCRGKEPFFYLTRTLDTPLFSS